MKQGWEIKKLGEVCDIINGFAFKSNLFTDEGEYILRISNIQNGYIDLTDIAHFNKTDYPKVNLEKYAVLEDDIVVALSGATTGKFGINKTGQKLYLNQRVAICRENTSKLNHLYLLFYLRMQAKSFLESAEGVAQPNLSTELMKQIPIPVPPLPVQEQIVSKLDLLSSITEKKREQLKELDALAQSIFYDMFGDPITNEKGWEVKKLGEVCKVNPSKKDTSIGLSNSDIVSFLPMEDLPIKACYHSPKQTRLFSEVQSSYTCFANNDVLMAKVTPCFENGKIGIASNLMNGFGYGSSEFIVIRANNIDVIKEYPYFVIQNTSFIENACAQLTGTSGLRRVPRQYVENCNISIPPLPLQHQFATKIEAIEKQKELIKQSISETETLFNARMQHYFN